MAQIPTYCQETMGCSLKKKERKEKEKPDRKVLHEQFYSSNSTVFGHIIFAIEEIMSNRA